MSFISKVFVSLFICFFCFAPVSRGCFENCESGTDACTDRLCKACIDDGEGAAVCNDCCEGLNQQAECQLAGCKWEYSNIAGASECRNESGVDCSGIPEVPTKSKTWLIIAFSLAGLGLAGALRFKKRKAL